MRQRTCNLCRSCRTGVIMVEFSRYHDESSDSILDELKFRKQATRCTGWQAAAVVEMTADKRTCQLLRSIHREGMTDSPDLTHLK